MSRIKLIHPCHLKGPARKEGRLCYHTFMCSCLQYASTAEEEKKLFDQLFKAGLYMVPGFALHAPEPGWIRITKTAKMAHVQLGKKLMVHIYIKSLGVDFDLKLTVISVSLTAESFVSSSYIAISTGTKRVCFLSLQVPISQTEISKTSIDTT